MSPAAVAVIGACLTAALVIAFWEWVRTVVSVYQWFMRSSALADGRPSSCRRVAQLRKHTRQIASDEDRSQGPQARPPEGVDGDRSGCDVTCFPRTNYHGLSLGILPLAAGLQPDFDAFFGGLQAAVAAGGVLVIALVVVLAVRRLTSL